MLGQALSITIGELLNRRTDLSTFVVHLTRTRDLAWTAKASLMSIAADQIIQAKTPRGWARDQDDATDPAKQSQRVVCFSETPLEHVDTLAADIAGRENRLEPWGLVFTKMTARRAGVNPVWYVDKTPGQATGWEIGTALDQLTEEAKASGFHSHPSAKVLPFFEHMGTWPTTGGQKEFWWEREWRKRGSFPFRLEQVVCWIVPAVDQVDFIKHVQGLSPAAPVRCIDAKWSLERIIAQLTGQSPISPFE